MIHQSPPNWAPNALPTRQGWVHPTTGELLVSKKGLLNPVEGYSGNQRPKFKNSIQVQIKSPEKSKDHLELKILEKSEDIFVELTPEPVVEISQPIRKAPRRSKKKV